VVETIGVLLLTSVVDVFDIILLTFVADVLGVRNGFAGWSAAMGVVGLGVCTPLRGVTACFSEMELRRESEKGL
jgi:hypothetical protein